MQYLNQLKNRETDYSFYLDNLQNGDGLNFT